MGLLVALPAWAGQAAAGSTHEATPTAAGQEAPGQVPGQVPGQGENEAQGHAKIPVARPCRVKRDASAMLEAGTAAAMASNPEGPALDPSLRKENCPPLEPLIDWYARFIDGPQVKRLTPKEKAWLAFRNMFDPYNGITIVGSSAIYVGANSHSAYGPGMAGLGRNVGVSFTEDLTGEFFGTFLIPSIVHQDPHYHRLPDASMKRRIAHAIYQVVWTHGDDGNEMLNYADLVGFAIDDEIGNFYVPGQRTDVRSSAERYATGLATAPIENFIIEFFPDVARHIHVHDVLIQHIINQVAKTNSAQ
jgi:hypothetical protein